LRDLVGERALQLYRIVQEALTNVIRHAHADNAWIDLKLNADESIEIVIRDDGRGFDIDQPHSGFGLSGIRERVAGLGGRFTLTTLPGAGVSLQIRIPHPRETS
jgi:two-component system sensor histidine kinase UhpB